MISSRGSSRPSAPAIDSQIALLAKNAVNGEETMLRQTEKPAPPAAGAESFTDEEANDELPLEEENSGDGKAGLKKGENAGKGAGGKKAKGTGKTGQNKKTGSASASASAKKINDMVAMHQQTDDVELPTKGDLALQKILEIKDSGSKHQLRTPEAILDVVSSYKSSIVHCYNKALKQYSKLEGRLVVEFTITAQGEVSKAEIVSSTLEKTNSGLEDCVISMVRSWRFAPIPLGTTTVVYPFVFFPTL